jgi:hypothetical protein
MAESRCEKCVVKKPAYEVMPKLEVNGRIPAMTLMSGHLVPGAKMYVETGWVVGMPDPNPHTGEHSHDCDEIILHIGTDPRDPEDLGGKIEIGMDGHPVIINSTSGIYVPRGVKHGPLVWKKFTKPHPELTIMIGDGTLTEADPGGHEKSKKEKKADGQLG